MKLTTTYMGRTLRNPLVVSASPISKSLDNFKRVEDAGAGGIVMFSLFEEQLLQEMHAIDYFMAFGSDSFAEAMNYFPPKETYSMDSHSYLELLSKAARSIDIPVYGSLNGITPSGWTEWARYMEQAGAAGIELNLYFLPIDPSLTAQDIESKTIDVLRSVKEAVRIPVAVKLGPYYSAFANFAHRLDLAGADALVLFNRFYQPDIDIERLEVTPNLQWSTSTETRLPLRWIAILYKQINASLAATSGVHQPADLIKFLLAGADVAMTTSALLRHGIGHITDLLAGLEAWMEKMGYASVEQMQGILSRRNAPEPTCFERANYIRVLQSVPG